MAESNPWTEFGSKAKSTAWYSDPEWISKYITPAQRDLLQNYSHIASEDVIPHILNIRDKAWEVFPYPCIGRFGFTKLSMSQYAVYPALLSRLKSGANLLDIGCCLGQDLRKLVHDGAPASNIYALELSQDFLDLGFEFFRDKETLGVHFMVADFLDKDGELYQLVPKMNVVHLGLFLHLFSWNKQVEAWEKVISLLKPEKRVLIIGQQMGILEANEVARGNNKVFAHNADSFKRMWLEIGQNTQTEWSVKAEMDHEMAASEKNGLWIQPNRRRLVFEVERL